MAELTVPGLKQAARDFLHSISGSAIPTLFGVTDGKKIGTYVEIGFQRYLQDRFEFTPGNAASGIDFPELGVDLKVTSIRQPQSSSPYRSASQKVYGLGHDLLVCVYDKTDDHDARAARLDFLHAIFIARNRTGDYQTTRGLLEILARDGNQDDIVAFLEERNLPLDEIGRAALADQILRQPPEQGFLTISNALQWRLQYGRAIATAAAGSSNELENLLA